MLLCAVGKWVKALPGDPHRDEVQKPDRERGRAQQRAQRAAMVSEGARERAASCALQRKVGIVAGGPAGVGQTGPRAAAKRGEQNN